MVGNVKSLVDRLSKDFSSARPPLSIHEPRKTVMPKSSPVQHVITTFAYRAVQDDELTLELGDIIEVLEEVEDGWSRGRQLRTGLVGMFPTNFVKPDVAPTTTTNREEDKGVVIRHAGDLPDLPEANRRTPSVVGGNSFLNKALHAETKEEPKTKEMARVKFEYEPQHSDELRLGEIGQLITIIRKDCGDAGWFEGEINGRRGLFPDNFVELVQVPVNTRSGTIYHQPTHHPKVIGKAPAASPASIVPPAVPAKPLKQKMSESSTSINGAGSSPPSSSSVASSAPVLPSQVKQQNSAFAAARDRISKDLIVGQPGQVASKLTKSVVVTSGSESVATARPVSNIETEEASEDVARPLSHVTKNRVRPPGKRPVSMLLIKKKGSSDNLIESASQSASSEVVENSPFSSALFTATTPTTTSPPTSHPVGYTQKMSSTTTTTPPAKIVPIRPPPAELKKEDKREHSSSLTGTKSSTSVTAHSPMTTSLSSSVDSEWVSRKEYNELLSRLSALEARVAQLEKR
ncbi:unnamed protein product [Cylicocyclus nassatus]|uniref:SH3 domain-containing protein n=1 Tax=Cylicocyclus nassatus TaxID=53992 RepID=A0AA36DUC5_CYLNA|nr:unnamed protein product [Cylicocyclus nassatus]